ncbi:MAG TPA: MgtC/SapB family protein [Rhodanobacteraceae bacterium]|nr:MgtC/SapB family protein [Rhodanobacteraceae bacterium]
MADALATAVPQLLLLGNVLLAMVLGGAIGFEREAAERPAGLRTHMLLGAAAALLVGLGDPLISYFGAQGHGVTLRVDPMRLVEAVVTAVGFLGAGTIFRHHGKQAVVGLTTAASMLMVAAIGISIGLRQYVLAVGVTVFTLLVLRILRRFEAAFKARGGRA